MPAAASDWLLYLIKLMLKQTATAIQPSWVVLLTQTRRN